MKRSLFLIALIAVVEGLFVGSAAEARDRRSNFTFFINPGVALGTRTASTYRLNDGTFLESTTSRDETSRLIEWEASYSFFQFFSLSALLEGTKYNNLPDREPDSHYAFLAVPRLQTGDDGLTFWAGAGVGFISSKLGQTDRPGAFVNYQLEPSTSGFAFSPRIGMDYVMEGYTLGIQLSYLRTSGTMRGTALDKNTSISAPMNEQFERSWWSITAKFGFQL